MAALPYVSILLCIGGTLISLISIMAFFLGTADGRIYPYVWVQIAIAAGLAVAALQVGRWIRARTTPPSRISQLMRTTPAWLLVALTVVLCLMLLGELAVLIARIEAGETTDYLYHLPSLCIIVYCLSFWLHSMYLLTRQNSPFRGY